MKYLSRLHSHIKKEVILFEVKNLDEACKKAMYMEAKHGKKPDEGASTSKSKVEKTHARMETNLPNKRKFSHSVQKKLHCEHCQKNGHIKDHC